MLRVESEPGIGKSALVEAMLAGASGCRLLAAISDATNPARRWRVAVLSGDAFNTIPGAAPFCVPLTRRSAGPLPPFVVELTDPDPVGGVALVGELLQIPARYGLGPVGMLTGASVARLGAALRDLFQL